MVEPPLGSLPAVAAPLGIETIAGSIPKTDAAPVHLWNPPYCGDIGLEIRADGTWVYQGSAITRRPLVELFASVLRKDDDGKTYLVTPVEKVDVWVVDAPFLAVELQVSGSGEAQDIRLRTNLDTWVRIDRDHPIRFGLQEPTGGLKPYVLVRGRLEALVVRAVYFDLVELVVTGAGDAAGLWSGGIWWPVSA